MRQAGCSSCYLHANERMPEAQARSHCIPLQWHHGSTPAACASHRPQWNGTAASVLPCQVETFTSRIRLFVISLPTVLYGWLCFQIALLIRLVLQPNLLAVLARSINFYMSLWKLYVLFIKSDKKN